MKILLLEDDEMLNEVTSSCLNELGYEVDSTYDGQEALDRFCENHYDLLILDINVPQINGFELLKNIREDEIYTPVIFTTSLDDIESVRKGFKNGCDDYLKKPFDLEELNLRIQYIKKNFKIEDKSVFRFSENSFYDFDSSTLFIYKKEIVLSKMEKKVMEYFIKNINRTISIDELSLNIWNYDNRPTDSTIRTYIKNLRKKLGSKYFETVKGLGYTLKNSYCL